MPIFQHVDPRDGCLQSKGIVSAISALLADRSLYHLEENRNDFSRIQLSADEAHRFVDSLLESQHPSVLTSAIKLALPICASCICDHSARFRYFVTATPLNSDRNLSVAGSAQILGYISYVFTCDPEIHDFRVPLTFHTKLLKTSGFRFEYRDDESIVRRDRETRIATTRSRTRRRS